MFYRECVLTFAFGLGMRIRWQASQLRHIQASTVRTLYPPCRSPIPPSHLSMSIPNTATRIPSLGTKPTYVRQKGGGGWFKQKKKMKNKKKAGYPSI